MATSNPCRGHCLAGLHLTLLLRGPGQARYYCQGTGHHHRPQAVPVAARLPPGGPTPAAVRRRNRDRTQPGDAQERARGVGLVMRRPQWSPNTLYVHEATLYAKEQGWTTASTTWPPLPTGRRAPTWAAWK